MATKKYMESVEKIRTRFEYLKKELSKVIVGQAAVVDEILVAIMCGGNALLESYPGLGKTLMIKTLAKLLDLKFSRIQSTPDLMPSDITGTYLIEEHRGEKRFKFQKGPVFSNIVLADEINRATPKTQAALLEAMQERQVTVGNTTFPLDLPFFVLATQNPIDQEGTYPLPEAQVDRFIFKILVGYPQKQEEFEIIERFTGHAIDPGLKKVFNKEQLLTIQKLVRQVPIADDIKQKVVTLVNFTRENKDLIEYGASPRASLGIVLAAKAHALLGGRSYVSMKDIEAVSYPVLRHRIILSFKAERDGLNPDAVIGELLKKL
ncbi:MoxR family ATPase [Candidatus Woesearchaeota archaeon]|jgi:MoxR-like ATPase|nr:MoxR family ATPase [Candidatus Woesearchaeota archaeon]MBT6520249.1 MoxR family ATPase [Candidatus Woesearchaeota archaeon]MBT7368017.1 MoxR family ATPase [Candidatus Woesearchaeota archaeon]